MESLFKINMWWGNKNLILVGKSVRIMRHTIDDSNTHDSSNRSYFSCLFLNCLKIRNRVHLLTFSNFCKIPGNRLTFKGLACSGYKIGLVLPEGRCWECTTQKVKTDKEQKTVMFEMLKQDRWRKLMTGPGNLTWPFGQKWLAWPRRWRSGQRPRVAPAGQRDRRRRLQRAGDAGHVDLGGELTWKRITQGYESDFWWNDWNSAMIFIYLYVCNIF